MTDSHPSDHYVHESTDPHGSVGRIITVESQRKDLNTIFLKLQIADSTDFCNEIIV
jgi:WNK lysine deficient protein kinase